MSTTTGHPSNRAPADDSSSGASTKSGLQLSLPQVLGGALAAVTSALAASSLGVAGTLAGAFVGSLIATIGAAVYSESLNRAGKRLRVVRPAGSFESAQAGARPPDVKLLAGHRQDADALVFVSRRKPAARRWFRWTVSLAAALGIALAALTALEVLIGHPVSGSTRSGTTVGDAVGGSAGPRQSEPVPVTSSTSTPTGTSTPSATAPSTTTPSTTSSSGQAETPSSSATVRQFGPTGDTSTTAPPATSSPPGSSTAGQPAG